MQQAPPRDGGRFVAVCPVQTVLHDKHKLPANPPAHALPPKQINSASSREANASAGERRSRAETRQRAGPLRPKTRRAGVSFQRGFKPLTDKGEGRREKGEGRRRWRLTGVGGGGADEAEGESLLVAEDLVDAVEDGGVEVAEPQNLLLHEHDGAADPALLPRLLVLPRESVEEPVQQHPRRAGLRRGQGRGVVGGQAVTTGALLARLPTRRASELGNRDGGAGRSVGAEQPVTGIYSRV